MFRILNAKCECRFQTVPAEPKVEVVRLPGHTVVYDVNSMAAVEVDDRLAAEIVSDPNKVRLPGLIHWPYKPQFAFNHQTECRFLCLEVTHCCNLACAYCFVRNYYADQGGMMTMETARRAIDMIPPDRPLSIGFFGGEPLLNWKLIQAVVAYVSDLADKRKVGKHFHIATNAILLDDERIRFLDENGFSLVVSLDGPEEVHNRLRPAKSKAINSQQATLASLRRFKDTKNLKHRTTLRSTYTGLGADLVTRLEYLNALIQDGCAGHASVEPCSLNESACLRLPDGHPLAITPRHFDALKEEYHAAAEWYVAEIRAGKRPAFHHCMKPLERLLYTVHAPSECGAGCGYFSVDPAGNIYGCHRESKSLIGHLDTGIDEELRAKWRDNRIYARPDCVACPIKHVCGGGCRLDSLERHDDIHKPDKVGCFFKRRMFEEALWIMCELGPERLQTIIRNPREYRKRTTRRRLQLRKVARPERSLITV